jgi:hypothetical protein
MKENNNKTHKVFKVFVKAGVLLFILSLAFYVYYDNYVKKEDNTKKTPTNTSTEPTPINIKDNTPVKTELVGVYKTSDGKNVLKIVSKDDSEAVKKAQDLGINVVADYYGYYNDKLFIIYQDDEIKDTKYIKLGGVEEGNSAQCRDTHSFIINILENSLVNLKYEYKDEDNEYGVLWNVLKLKEHYYFYNGGCMTQKSDVYDENLKKIGEVLISTDSNDNFYVYLNGEVIKYNSEGNVLKKSVSKYKSNHIENDGEGLISPIEKNDNLYFVKTDYSDNNKQYIFVDFMNDIEEPMVDNNNYVLNGFSLDENSNLIKIEFRVNELFCKDCNKDEVVSYTYNLTDKSIIKN